MTLFQLLSTVETPLVLSSVPPADFCCFSLLPLCVCTKAKASHSTTRAAGTASLLAWTIARNRSEHFLPAFTAWLRKRWPSCADGWPWVQQLLHHGQISNFQLQHRFGRNASQRATKVRVSSRGSLRRTELSVWLYAVRWDRPTPKMS